MTEKSSGINREGAALRSAGQQQEPRTRTSHHGALRLAATRLGILADRLEGCNAIAVEEGRPVVHELIAEARMFEHEAREAAGMEPR